jgi:hypothetical protein
LSSPFDASDARSASSAELSLDISRVVSQVLTGESVDTAKKGEELAAKYPDLGMSAAMIEDAIGRAAGMVGMIRDGETPPAAGSAEISSTNGSSAAPDAARMSGVTPAEDGAPGDFLDEDFAALEFGTAAHVNGYGAAGEEAEPPKSEALGGLFVKGPVAALRRAFFRS